MKEKSELFTSSQAVIKNPESIITEGANIVDLPLSPPEGIIMCLIYMLRHTPQSSLQDAAPALKLMYLGEC